MRMFGGVLAVLTSLSATASAQVPSTSVFVGGGATVPIGDYKEYAKTGFLADAGIGRTFGSGRVFAFADVFYGRNSHETADESTTLLGGGANVGLSSTAGTVRPYAYVGLGMQNHKYNPAGGGDGGSETKPYGRGAVGLSLGSGKTTFWVEAGLIQGFGGDDGNTGYLPIQAGISISW
jgi:hypothetical protein